MYFKYLKLQLKTSLQYKASSIMLMISQAFSLVAVVVGIILLFQRYGNIGGYNIYDVLITFSIVIFVFSVCEMMFRGLDQFSTLVRTGELDRLLIRPRGMLLQIIGYKVEMNKLGRVLLGVGLIIYTCIAGDINWTLPKILVLISMMISGVIIYLGVFLCTASVSIFTIQGIEVVNVITDGGRDVCSYPLDIYNVWFKRIFTYIIPFGCFNYLPLKFLLDAPGATVWGNALAPLYGMLFVIPAYFIFKWSLTKYKSTGS